MIISCGEALIDFVPVKTAEGFAAYRPLPGGSPFNVACALGRLGAPAGLMGALATDFFGDMLFAALRASRVDGRFITRLDRPTTLGFVSLEHEEPRYAFYDATAADREWPGPQAPIPAEVSALHFGSISLLREPAATAYEALALAQTGRQRLISLDPNIRPGLVRDEAAYRARLDRMIAAAHLVKVSGADLDWIAPGRPLDDIAADWLARGPSLVVITRGVQGATAYRRSGRLTQPAEPVQVVDTVGAGDSFMAGLLAGLDERGVLTPTALGGAPDAALHHAMALAQRTASITCSRAGADAPWRRELGELAE
jgi:fructokinase